MFPINGYWAAVDVFDRFKFQNLDREARDRLLQKLKWRTLDRLRRNASPHAPYCIPTLEEAVSEVGDQQVWKHVHEATERAFKSALWRAPLYLISASSITPVSVRILRSYIVRNKFEGHTGRNYLPQTRWTYLDAATLSVCVVEHLEAVGAAKSLLDSTLSDQLFISTRTEIERLKEMEVSFRGLIPFEGHNLAIREDDVPTSEVVRLLLGVASANDLESVSPPQREASLGRPRKQEKAALLYRTLYPEGHEASGLTWAEVVKEITLAGDFSVSIDTLRRGLTEQ